MRLILFLMVVLTSVSCERFFIDVGAGESGLVFSKLPKFLGGGLSDRIVASGERTFILPYQQLFIFNTGIQEITFGADNEDSELSMVETRTLGGNEVGLSVSIKYRIDPTKLKHLIQYVGNSNDRIKEIVIALARADIRTHFNALATSGYFDSLQRKHASDDVRESLRSRLGSEGIIIDSVIYRSHIFRRGAQTGSDDKIQQLITETQTLLQNAEQEKFRRAAEVQKLKSELKDAEANTDKLIKQARGKKDRSIIEANAYYETQKNKAEQISYVGEQKNAALRAQVSALAGAGGRTLLKQELAESLTKAAPKFYILNQSKSNFNLNKTDVNQLLEKLLVNEDTVADVLAPTTGKEAAAKELNSQSQ